MTPVGGIVVAVALFAVAMTTVFGADDVCFLECRAGRGVEVREQTVVSEKGKKEEGKNYAGGQRKRSRYNKVGT